MKAKLLASLAVLSMVAAPTLASAATSKAKPDVHKTHKKKDKTGPATPGN